VSGGLLSSLRLRHRLALSLSIAAILPVIVAAGVAVRVVLAGLESGLHTQTERQVRVAVNLVLRQVERVGADAVRLATTPDLAHAIPLGGGTVSVRLARLDPELPSALVHVADPSGRVLATRAIGGDPRRYDAAGIGVDKPMIERGRAYERAVTLAARGDVLVVRAVAPIVDESYGLRGVVLVSMPLDADFADSLKGALGNDVLIHAASGPARSSFVDDEGGRLAEIAAPEAVRARVMAGEQLQVRATIAGREYSVGYASLKDLDGQRVGMLAVAVPRDQLTRAKRAAGQSLALGAAGAFLFALGLAGLLSRRLTKPLQRLHAGALAVAAGDLDVRIDAPTQGPTDELGELSAAFATMTASLRDNRERLAARMREIVGLHEAGRAVSSVLGLDEVLRKVVDSVARVLETRLAALWLTDDAATSDHGAAGPRRRERTLKIVAARAKPLEPAGGFRGGRASQRSTMVGEVAENVAEALHEFAGEVAAARLPQRLDRVSEDSRFGVAALRAQIDGSLLAVPLERKGDIIGVLVVGRTAKFPAFSDADENLLATFADQVATAIDNARLYEEVRAFSGELEEKVRLRTRELTSANAELQKALSELRDTQAQLILSERLAGLGALVAGVAHEINSPSAAIRGSVDALADNVRRLARRSRELGMLGMPDEARQEFLTLVEELAPKLAEKRVAAPAEVRRRARELAAKLQGAGLVDAEGVARQLAELGADDAVELLLPLLTRFSVEVLVGYLNEYAYLHRNTTAIHSAIRQIARIVGALKSYSHLDQAKVEPADVHEGIENTLTILHHELKYGIVIQRRYGQLPRVPVYVDELNQVWTNLIHNAVQALGGRGEITIETSPPSAIGDTRGAIAVRVIDNGPGVAADVLPRIFEPFFTTKVKGEGTGLGLGIVRKIVDKHGGRVEVDSRPGRTCFTVYLPVLGPSPPSPSSSPPPQPRDVP
jgi:signal transduction histidine kinase